MNERNVSERIVRAVDARLSGLTGDPWMAQHVLARAEEELPNRRKKRAAALIVAAVLAFLLATVPGNLILHDAYSQLQEKASMSAVM